MKITEIFYSIQGEGIQSGLPTIFIRLAGCNLRCKWCDTKYAYNNGTEMTVEEVIKKVKSYSCKLVCITGGEPLTQPETNDLINGLLKLNYKINIETNGSIQIEKHLTAHAKILISLDIKCPSSQMEAKMDFSNINLLKSSDQLKFVIEDINDYKYACEILESHRPVCNIIFTPVGGTDLKWLAEKILDDHLKFEQLGLNVRVLPQLHKLIWGEARGK